MTQAILYTKDTYLVQMYKKNHVYIDAFVHLDTMVDIYRTIDEDSYVFYDYDGDTDALASLSEKVKVFVLSANPSYDEGSELLKYNIMGYSNRYIAPLHLKDALLNITAGKVWLYPEFIQEMIQRLQHKQTESDLLERVTNKEKEIALHVKKGMSNKEIAYQLNITVRTVKAHVSSIFEKLGVSDRLTLALKLQ